MPAPLARDAYRELVRQALIEDRGAGSAREFAGDAEFVIVGFVFGWRRHNWLWHSHAKTQRCKERRKAIFLALLRCVFASLRETLSRFTNRFHRFFNILLRSAKVCDAGAQCETSVHGRIRNISATALLHQLHYTLV